MRLINADALINHFQKEWEDCEISNATWIWIREVLRDQPTIDAVEVVRCGKCKWYQEGYDINGKWFSRCNGSVRTYGHTTPDWFCADGERREG